MLLIGILLFVAAVTGQTEIDSSNVGGYTNYEETSTDNCTGSVSICTVQLPFNISNPPDVWLDAIVTVPSIILEVDNIQARLNLEAKVASLVTITAGVAVSITTVQLKILGVRAHVQLAVRLDSIFTIVNRTLESLDLSPLLASTIKGVGSALDGLL